MREEDYGHEVSPFSDPEMILKGKLSLQWDLQDTFHTALQQDDFVGGVHNAAEQLDENASDVALCVLVDNQKSDPGIQIHCRLIEAFCWEFPIPVIKVDSSRKLMQLAGYSYSHPEAIYCILIKGKDKLRPSMEKLLRFSQKSPAPMLKLT